MAENLFEEFRPKVRESNPFAEFAPQSAPAVPAQAAPPKSGAVRRVLGDTAVDLGRGVVGVGEAVVGLANIPTFGLAGKGMEAIGFRPDVAKDMIGELYSPERQAAQQKVSEAEGFVGTAKTMLQNPSTIAGAAVESLPAMLGGGAVAQGLRAVRGLGAVNVAKNATAAEAAAAAQANATRTVARAALGEGAVGAGMSAEGIRQQSDDGLLSAKQVGAAIGTGIGTAALGAGGGALARRLGVADPDVLLAGGAGATGDAAQGALRRTLSGAVRGAAGEGVFEEMPQSMQEQAWENYALDRPVGEGVAEAGAMGLLTGAAMGGPVGAVSAARPRRTLPSGAPVPDPANGPLSRAVNAAAQSGDLEVAEAKKQAAAADTRAAAGEIDPRLLERGNAELARVDRRPVDTRPLARPWVDETTGVDRKPTDDEVRASVRDYLESVSAAGARASRKHVVASLGLGAKRVNAIIDDIIAERQRAAKIPEAPADVRAAGRTDPAGPDLFSAVDAGGRRGAAAGVQTGAAGAVAGEPAVVDPADAAGTPNAGTAASAGSVAPRPEDSMHARMLREGTRSSPPRGDETGNAAYEGRDVSTGMDDSDLGALAPSNMDPETGEELGIDAERWPAAPEHHQPAAIVRALVAQAAENKNKPAGVTAIASTFNVSKDTARALRNRALDTMNAEAGSQRRHSAPAPGTPQEGQPGPATAAGPTTTSAAAPDTEAPRTDTPQTTPPAGQADGSPSAMAAAPAQVAPAAEAPAAQVEAVPPGMPAPSGETAAGPALAGPIGESQERAGPVSEDPIAGSPEAAGPAAAVQAGAQPQATPGAPAEQPAARGPAATVEVFDGHGRKHRVRQGDLDGNRTHLQLYNRNGTRKDGPRSTIHRGNIDLTGEMRAEQAALDADNPLSALVTNRAGGAFKTAAAAKAHATKNGYAETHEVQPAASGRGFVLLRKPAAAPAEQLAERANEAATSPQNDLPEPTQAQKEAGNYAKGHVRLNGHEISIENPAGSKRDPKWPALKDHYGYIRGTVGKDKDHVDVFMTDRAHEPELPVFVVDQVNKDGSFDEHKVVMGAADEAEARAAYLRNYSKGWTGLGAITQMSQDEFKAWVRDPKRTSRPAEKLAKPARAATEGRSARTFDASQRRLVDEAPNGIRVGDRVVVADDRRGPYEATVSEIEVNAAPAYGGTAFKVARDDAKPDGRGTGWVAIDRISPAPGAKAAPDETQVARGEAAAATHRDAGDPAEPVTVSVVNEALRSSASKTTLNVDEARQWLLDRIDEAMAAASPNAPPVRKKNEGDAAFAQRVKPFAKKVGYTTFEVPGDGSFRVLNAQASLAEFRSKVEKSPGFKAPKKGPPPLGRAKSVLGTVPVATEDAAKKGHGHHDDESLAELERGQKAELRKLTQELRAVPSADARSSILGSQATDMARAVELIQREQVRRGLREQTDQDAVSADPVESDVSESESAAPAPAATDPETAPAAAKAAAPGPKPENAAANTGDAGEELWYNRRNRSGAGVQWSDVEGLNDTLKVKEVVKSKVWPRPDYEQLVADGLRPEFAHLVKQVYDTLATKPRVRGAPTDQQLQDYIETVGKVREAVFAFVRDNSRVGAAIEAEIRRASALQGGGPISMETLSARDESMLDAVFPKAPGERGRWRSGGRTNENNARANLVGSNKLVSALQVTGESFSEAIKAVSEGWPAPQKAWQRVYKIRKYGSGWMVSRAGRTVARQLTTKEEAEAAAKAHYDEARQAGKGGMAAEARAVEQAQRVGPAHRRPDEDVSSERLMETFGFRGINFGNWMKGDTAAKRRERQLHLNHAYDALLDLSDITGLPPKAISLEGKLGLAFGAQGSGRAAAHFAPGVNEINLTRRTGAGGIAHEWAHALDHYFATQAGEVAARSPDPFLTQIGRGERELMGIRPEISRAFQKIVNAMERRPLTQAELDERDARARQHNTDQFEKALAPLRAQLPEGDEAALATFDELAERLRAGDQGEGTVPTGRKVRGMRPRTRVDEVVSQVAGQMLSLLREHGADTEAVLPSLLAADSRAGIIAYQAQQAEQRKGHVPQTGEVNTSYLTEARALESKSAKRGTGKAYWSTPWELFARAFESYAFDRLAAAQRRSDYLTWPQVSEADAQAQVEAGLVDGDRYPRGAERTRINEAFDTLLAEIKTEDTVEGQVRLFSKAPPTDETFFSALLRAVETAKGAPRRAAPAAWKQWLDGAQRRGELKQEERDWLGVDAWLDGQETVTREALADYVRANQVQVQEVVLGGPDPDVVARLPDGWTVELDPGPGLWVVRDADGEYMGEGDTSNDAIRDTMDRDEAADIPDATGEARYHQYQLPGGENYRELLLTLPVELSAEDVAEVRALAAKGRWEEAARKEANARRRASYQNKVHFDQPNILAHVRFNERVDEDGKRVLFLEEVQSDWHQAGRKRGYGRTRRYEVVGPSGTVVASRPSMAEAQARADELGPGHKTRVGALMGIPDAPFKTTWPMLAFKRMVRYAADHGFDRIAWTTGQQQFDRYPHGDEDTKNSRLNGMEGFYDRVLPTEVNKLVKRFGAKVGATAIPTGEPAAVTVHSVDVTPELRRAALGGQPLFSASKGAAGSAPLTFDRALQLKARITGGWGKNAPNVVLVENAEGFPDFAKVDPDYRRGEGLWGGRQTIWINVDGIATEQRFVEVMAHEAVGHFGVEAVVGRDQWTGIVASIANHDRNGTGAPSLRRAMADVHRRYGRLDAETFAKETIAVMAEQGARNGIVARVVAAVRAFLRRIMPDLAWSSADVTALLAASESFLRAGRSQAEIRAAVGSAEFSRRGWASFPDAVLGHGAGVAAAHPDYELAKAGNNTAALRLARDLVSERYVAAVREALPAGANPTIVPVLAQESAGRNRIPVMVAQVLGEKLGLRVDVGLFQRQRVARGGSDGFHRLANPPRFTGAVAPGDYLILDDTLAQGGTLAELKTHIEDNGGRVLLATALTGKLYSATMAPTNEQLARLRERYADLEPWWRDTFGHGFEGFTASEARFLLKLKGRPGTDAIRARVDAARIRGGDGLGEGTASDRSGTEAPGASRGPDPAVGGLLSLAPRLETDARGRRTIRAGGATFREVGNRFYLTDKAGRLRDFRDMNAARAEADRLGAELRIDDPVEGEPQTFSVVLPEAAERVAGVRRPLFSKAASDVLDDIDAVMADVHREGLYDRAKQWLKDATPKKIKDELRGTWLGALTTRHLTELGGDYFQNIGHYSDFLARQQADQNTLAAEAEAIVEPARKWAGKNRAEARRLFDLMHQATIDGVDPAEDYQPLQFEYGGKRYEATPKNVKDALRAIREQMLGRSGDNKKDMMAEAKRIREMPARERARRKKYPRLVDAWNALAPEAKDIYIQFRDAYTQRADEVEKALIARINDTDAPDNRKRQLINTIRMQFETQRLSGVYFPLQRHGRYFVAAEKDGTSTFLMFERLSELERAVKGLKSRGVTITAQGLKAAGKAKDAPSGTFVAEIIEQLEKSGVSDQTQDQIYQIYLQSLPELSMRKHAIHRKSVPGFDPDAIRAFAFNMHHGAHQLARLRWAHKRQDVLELLKQQQDAERRKPEADTRHIAAGDAILEELNRRDEWINNPQDSQVTNLVSSFGFAYYLGLTPAAAVVNLTQTAMVSFPWLAARYGHAKAMNELLKAGAAAGRTVGNIQNTLTDPVEKRAHAVLLQMGAIEKTQAHNLAGIAEGGLAGYNPKWAKTMEIVGWAFHKAEVINREATGMAAFRLARAAGESFEQAVKTASTAIYDTHFDYSNANRARWMQSGAAKVLLMFRQFSLNMTWHLARMTWQATKGQDPEVRALARRNLAGVLGMAAVFAGVLGLPMMKATMSVLNAVAASAGDDDEPWDAETEFRAWLASMVGPGVAELMLTGPVNALTGADVHSRVSLSEIWFRDADRELDGRGQYYHLLEQAAGPMGGVLKNALVGKALFDDGHTWRGIETVLPKALKDAMKSIRYQQEGVNNLRGDPVVEDPSLWQALLQLQGFTPAQAARQYDTNRSLKNYEQHILDRRQNLMNSLAMAYRLGDQESRAQTMAAIAKFNRSHPEIGITTASIRRSIASRARYSAKAEAGIVLNPKIAAKVRAQVVGEN